jgi:hypothetical protein
MCSVFETTKSGSNVDALVSWAIGLSPERAALVAGRRQIDPFGGRRSWPDCSRAGRPDLDVPDDGKGE